MLQQMNFPLEISWNKHPEKNIKIFAQPGLHMGDVELPRSLGAVAQAGRPSQKLREV